MGDTPRPDEAASPDHPDETAKLELPSLPGLRRRKRKPPPADVSTIDPAPAPAEAAPTAAEPAPLRDEPAPAAPEPTAVEPALRRRARPALPSLPGWVAAALTGLVVGIVGGLLTYASLRGCGAVRGTETCGGGPGLLLLLVVLALMVLLGGVLLRLWDLTEPRSTSFLAVGVLCVVLMVTALQELLNGWMFFVVPVLAAAAYAVAHVVTSTYVDPGPERGPQVDVR